MTCVLCCATSIAAADTVTIQPKVAKPGDAVLVVVRGADGVPHGKADGKPLHFARAKNGYQAVFAVPLDMSEESIVIDVDGLRRRLAIKDVEFPETNVIVEDEYANPPAEDRKRIDEDNRAILDAAKADSGPQFTRAFQRPRGEVTSKFGEWRTFNDGHRSQHLGMDVFAREGTKVRSVNGGTVTLVRDTFLAGNVVVIAHGNGIASAYFHLSATNVKEGEFVQANEVIGRAGQTGRATGPHLHLAVHVPGGFVDPATFMRLPIAAATPMSARRAILRSR